MQAGSATDKTPPASGAYSGTIQLSRGGSVPHRVAIRVSGTSVTGLITSTVNGKGYTINLNGTYTAGSNRISGTGTVTNVKNGTQVTFRGSIQGGTPIISVQIKQPGSKSWSNSPAQLQKG